MNERDVLLNELAQGLRPMSQGIEWFDSLGQEEQPEVLLFLRHHCVQARAVAEDAPESIRRAGLRPTHTPAVPAPPARARPRPGQPRQADRPERNPRPDRPDPVRLPHRDLASDRAYTDQVSTHFAQPARRLGYQLVLDYKRENRGVQGTHEGALLVDGSLACPAMPTALAQATIALSDKAVRGIDDDPLLREQIAAREPYYLRLKESADERGAIRLQCPASGPSPAVACPRFSQVHQIPAPRPPVVDLTDRRATAAHTAAKPTVPIPQAERLRPLPKKELPRICQKPTITVRPGDLGKRDKFRQDRHYLHPRWQDAYRPGRANIEGANGRLKSHGINIADPSKRLAHGRVAQTILLALMVCSANLQMLFTWGQTAGTTANGDPADVITEPSETAPGPLAANGLSPPQPPTMVHTST
ncbi:DUF5958 family protein [Streptomyces niveus]|uniref:DUF5958 family protein n=1 Tax=Streptomyces niveus TaxID=193462 RepID=UPI003413C34D